MIQSCPDSKDQFGKGNQCEGCPGQSLCRSFAESEDPDEWAISTRMKVIKHKIIVMSGKGGVGKSTFAVNLAIGLAKQGNKVAVLDVDICGPSIPKLLNCEKGEVVNQPWGWVPAKGLYDIAVMSVGFLIESRDTAVIWKGPRKTSMIKRFLKDTFWGKLDYLIIDTPPGTSDEHLSTILSLRCANPDGGIIVTTPQEISLSTIKKEINFCKKIKLPILGIVENMSGFVCPCCNETTRIFPTSYYQKLIEEHSLNNFGSIPLDPRVSESGELGTVLYDKHPDSPAVISLNNIIESLKINLQNK
jgi:Mrp family chromosome partitioning ATPase